MQRSECDYMQQTMSYSRQKSLQLNEQRRPQAISKMAAVYGPRLSVVQHLRIFGSGILAVPCKTIISVLVFGAVTKLTGVNFVVIQTYLGSTTLNPPPHSFVACPFTQHFW